LTVKSLEAIVANADGDLKLQFDRFVNSLAALEAQEAVARGRREGVTSQGAAYFSAWEKQLTETGSAEIRMIAGERHEKLRGDYDAVLGLLKAGQKAYDPFMSDVRDLKKVLANDLNAAGVKAVAPQIEKVKEKARAVNEHIDKLSAELDINEHIDKLSAELDTIANIYSPGIE
jgi:hypothetical protein